MAEAHGATQTSSPPEPRAGERGGLTPLQSEFLASMSHEIRTPLNAIIGYTQLLEIGLGGPLTEVQREHLRRVEESSRHLLGLVNEVLDLARLEAGEAPVRREVHAAVAAVEAALDLVRPQAAERALTLSGRCEGDSAAAYVGDDDRVRQIVANLLSNAVKFTAPGGRVRASCGRAERADDPVEAAHGGPWTYVRVEDTGIGIAPDRLAAVFQPFVQADSALTRVYGGTGLGLTISRRLARLMGGDLTARSRPGEGSTFTLWLPAASLPGPPDLERPEARPADARLAGIATVGRSLADRAAALAAVLGARVREARLVPHIDEVPESVLMDHAVSFFSDAGQSMVLLEESAEDAADLVRDGSSIQRAIADRHGIQRHRIGWTEEALAREMEIEREVLDDFVRRAVEASEGANAEDALRLTRGMMQQFAELSLRSFRFAARSAARR